MQYRKKHNMLFFVWDFGTELLVVPLLSSLFTPIISNWVRVDISFALFSLYYFWRFKVIIQDGAKIKWWKLFFYSKKQYVYLALCHLGYFCGDYVDLD